MAKGGQEKRAKLVESAANLFHRKGIAGTTLAEVAEAAEVPPGNVYYYFKTRDDLIRSVVDFWTVRFDQIVAPLEQEPEPRERLKALARFWSDESDLVAEAGCPVGSLSGDLGKLDDELGQEPARLFGLLLDWASDQFEQVGCEEPRDCAVELLAGLQGAALLAAALTDPDLMKRRVERLERWIDALVVGSSPPAPA